MADSTQRRQTGPALETICLPDSLPAIKVGYALVPAGEWAEHIKKLKWMRADMNGPKSELLRKLAQLPSQNEPIIRNKDRIIWNPSMLHEVIGRNLTTIEAAMLQVVGTAKTPECTDCQKLKGPFSHCVVVDDIGGCANCRWRGKALSCSLNTSNELPPRRVYRRRITQAQRDKWSATQSSIEEEYKKMEERKDALTSMIGELREEITRATQKLTHLVLPGVNITHVFTQSSYLLQSGHERLQKLEREQSEVIEALMALGRNQTDILRLAI